MIEIEFLENKKKQKPDPKLQKQIFIKMDNYKCSHCDISEDDRNHENGCVVKIGNSFYKAKYSGKGTVFVDVEIIQQEPMEVVLEQFANEYYTGLVASDIFCDLCEKKEFCSKRIGSFITNDMKRLLRKRAREERTDYKKLYDDLKDEYDKTNEKIEQIKILCKEQMEKNESKKRAKTN